MKAKLFFLFSLIFTLVLMSAKWFTVPIVDAKSCKSQNAECSVNNSDKLCCTGLVCMDKGVPSENGKCQPKPTATPTPTPTPDDKVWCHEIKRDDKCKEELKDECEEKWKEGKCPVVCDGDCEPTPETTPSARVVYGLPGDGRSDGKSDGRGEFHPAACGGVFPDKPLLQGFKVIDSTTDEYSWWSPVSGVDKYAVVYGYKPDELVYGVDNISKDVTSIRIGNLRPNTQSWLQVWGFKGECVTKSDVFN
jgi:hypothetical protein